VLVCTYVTVIVIRSRFCFVLLYVAKCVVDTETIISYQRLVFR